MIYADILELARETAGRLGIEIKAPALILSNMEPKIGTTTILRNKNFTLWIDKHYIAYGDNFKPEIVYVFTDKEHISEELRSVIRMIQLEKSSYALKTLLSIKEQLELAQTAMKQSDSRLFLFEEPALGGKEVKDKSYTITLCYKCRMEFGDTGSYIKRVDPEQLYKEKCTYCNVRDGYDYIVMPKKQKEGR